jgi:hypothetical protein
MIDAHDQGVLPFQRMKTNFELCKKKASPAPPPGGVGIFGIFGFYSLPIRGAAFSDFIQVKGRLIRPSRGLRPRVFSDHRPLPQLQAQDSVMGRRPIAGVAYPDRQRLPSMSIFIIWTDLVPVQTFRLALRRKAGPRIALPAHRLYYLSGRYVTSVDHMGLLRRSARCSVITQRARMQQRPSQRPPPFLHVRPRALWLECGPVEQREEKTPSPTPAESHVAVCMLAASREAI